MFLKANLYDVTIHNIWLPVFSFLKKIKLIIHSYFFLGGTVIFFLASLFFVKYHLNAFCVWVACHYVMISALSLSYHRLLAHRTFTANRVTQFLIAGYGTLCLQRGPLWWSSMHRMHHHLCGTEEDPHTQSKGNFYCHFGWTIDPKFSKIRWEYVSDLARFPELLLLEHVRFILIPAISLFFYKFGGLAFVIAYHLAITTSINSIACLNSLCHQSPNCEAKNIYWLAMLTLGEGFHRDHHENARSNKAIFNRAGIDVIYLIIRFLNKLRLIREI